MRRTLLESLTHGPLTEAAPAAGDAVLAELAASVERAGDWGEVLRSAKSMPVLATAASWKSMRSAMRSTTSSGWGCDLSPRRVMPTCSW